MKNQTITFWAWHKDLWRGSQITNISKVEIIAAVVLVALTFVVAFTLKPNGLSMILFGNIIFFILLFLILPIAWIFKKRELDNQ
jgi:hypothetical protein